MKFFNIILISIFVFSSCENTNKTTNKNLSISFSIQGNQKIIGSFFIDEIRLISNDGHEAVLPRNKQQIHLFSGNDDHPLLLSYSKIDTKKYHRIRLDLSIPKESDFSIFSTEERQQLYLIDALKREIGTENYTTSVTIDLTDHNSHHLGLVFNTDKAFNFLFEEEDVIHVLFKPFITINTQRPNFLISNHRIESVDNDTITLKNLLDNSQFSMTLTKTGSMYIKNVLTPMRKALSIIKENPNGEFITAKHISNKEIFYYNHANIIINKAWITHQESDRTFITGRFFSADTKRYSYTTKSIDSQLTVYYKDSTGKPISGKLKDTLIGQSLSGYIEQDTAQIFLHPNQIKALVKTAQPLTIQPINVNGFDMDNAPEIPLTEKSAIQAQPGDLLELITKGTLENITVLNTKKLNNKQLALSITLPASRNKSLIAHIKEDGIWALTKNNVALQKLTAANSFTQLEQEINTIDLNNTQITVFVDRILDATRVYTIDHLADFYSELAYRLDAGYHINEIHASGVISEDKMAADHLTVVLYGPSIFDLVKTSDLVNHQEAGNILNGQEITPHIDSMGLFSIENANYQRDRLTSPVILLSGKSAFNSYAQRKTVNAGGQQFISMLRKTKVSSTERIKQKYIEQSFTHLEIPSDTTPPPAHYSTANDKQPTITDNSLTSITEPEESWVFIDTPPIDDSKYLLEFHQDRTIIPEGEDYFFITSDERAVSLKEVLVIAEEKHLQDTLKRDKSKLYEYTSAKEATFRFSASSLNATSKTRKLHDEISYDIDNPEYLLDQRLRQMKMEVNTLIYLNNLKKLNAKFNTIDLSPKYNTDNNSQEYFNQFATAFNEQTNKKYALLPVLDSTLNEHDWTALALIKEDNGKISAFHIKPPNQTQQLTDLSTTDSLTSQTQTRLTRLTEDSPLGISTYPLQLQEKNISTDNLKFNGASVVDLGVNLFEQLDIAASIQKKKLKTVFNQTPKNNPNTPPITNPTNVKKLFQSAFNNFDLSLPFNLSATKKKH